MDWPAIRASMVLRALQRIGWTLKRQSGSHRTLARPEWPDCEFAFHDREEIGPRMLARIATRTGLRPEDLCINVLRGAAQPGQRTAHQRPTARSVMTCAERRN
jgi:predicted RNA binding protein YcfA (HicA-like mRNA interferase family)